MGGSDAAAKQQKMEERRQTRIASGLQQINAIFDGGKYGYNLATGYTPGTSYFDATGNPYAPKAPVNDPRFATQLTKEMTDAVKNGALYTATGATPGFGPDFYNNRKQAYETYNMPLLNRQFRDTSQKAAFGLARQGTLNSSNAEQLASSLGREFNTQRQTVADNAIRSAQDLQRQVEDQRAQLIMQLQSSGDVNTAAQGALRAMSQLSAPSTIAPIGRLFADWQEANLNRGVAQQYAPLFDYYKNALSAGGGSVPTSTTVRR